MRPTSVTVSATGASAWIPVDYKQTPFSLGIQVDVSAGATLTWVVETTMDDIFNSTITPLALTDISGTLSTGTTDESGSITVPCRAIRLNCTVTSGNATMTVIQGNR